MRLIKYINESSYNISKYIKLLKEVPELIFYRGFGSNEPDFSIKHKVDKNRVPKGTDISIYPQINLWLQKNGFCRRDRSIFCKTHVPKYRDYFGTRYPIVPIGNFKYTYCKSDDFNFYIAGNDIFSNMFFNWLYIDEYYTYLFVSKTFKDLDDIIPDDVKDIKKYIDMHFSDTEIFERISDGQQFTKKELDDGVKNLKNMFSNKNIKDCIKHDWEIWIECDEYMIFESDEKYKEFIGNYNG